MNILLASPEVVPFCKTGGLADVVSALGKALAEMGHQVWLIVPHYPQSYRRNRAACPPLYSTGQTVRVPIGSKQVEARLLWAPLSGRRGTVFLVDQPGYFDRPGLYGEGDRDYDDNCERFVFFSRAVMETARQLVLRPEVVHTHDWQTGLVPALLEIEYRKMPELADAVSLFTIHNMAFQGEFWHWDMLLTGLDWKYFNWKQMEAYGSLNLLKTGIVFADAMTTVSPTYAREIQTPEYGCGLHGVLAARRENLYGILNGIDTELWNPAFDPHLPANYTLETLEEGKARCKTSLQKRLGLHPRQDVLLFGMISRMTNQKGLDLIAACAKKLPRYEAQFAFLGSGESRYETLLRQLARDAPDRIAASIGFDEELAHQIEAGADCFLMPSQYEPCGLNQMYSMAYGNVPLVRAVGGLADSVVDASPENLKAGTANGFSFQEYSSEELDRQIRRAIETFSKKPIWRQLMRTGMQADWSWQRSAGQYLELYERTRQARLTPGG